MIARYFTVENNLLVLEKTRKGRASSSFLLVLDYSWVLMQLAAVVAC